MVAKRKDIESHRANIIDALAVPSNTKDAHPMQFERPGVDQDMLTSTNDYFTKLLRNLDLQIQQTERRGSNARKTDRDKCWGELLAIWCELGGKPSGAAAADFLQATSKPVMGSAVPTFMSVVQWLDRRQNKAAKTVANPRRVA